MCHEITLSRGATALVSDEDVERVNLRKWCLDNNGYAVSKGRVIDSNGQRRAVKLMLHRFILDAPKGFDVDHINHDPLDNRRGNLRIATRSQNTANGYVQSGKSLYKGVSTYRHSNGWRVEICVNGARRHIGIFAIEVDAAIAYDAAALAAWGEFAYLNFPEHKHLYQLGLTIPKIPRRIVTSPTPTAKE